MIKRNYYKIVRVFPDPSSYFYIKNETMNQGWVGLFLFTPERLNEMTLDYSFDKVNWTRVTQNNNDIWIPADGYMYLRNTTGVFGTNTQVIAPHCSISIGGDIRTLFNYTDVESVTKIPDYGFRNPFTMQEGSKCIDISNLSFRGITEIGNYGLQNAFSGSGFKETKGVDLRDVTTLGEGALNYLYSNASNIKEVYAPNVSTWDTSKTSWWLENVASTGVVYKPSTLTIPTNSDDGIPYGWTTQDYPII